MGTNSLISRVGGVIQIADPNQYFTALNQDLVPRNISGVPTTAGGSLGSLTYKWASLYTSSDANIGGDSVITGKVKFGASASLLSLEESSTDIIMKRNGTEKFKITSDGILRKYLSTVNYVVSSSCGTFSTTSTTPVDVTNMSVSITTFGKPVLIAVISDFQSVGGASSSITSSSAQGRYIFTRDGTEISKQQTDALVPTSSLIYVDFPTAGTYNYKLRAHGTTAGTTSVQSSILLAVELV